MTTIVPKRTMWQGLPKLTEEMAELIQVLAKLQAHPEGKHPKQGDLTLLLEEEAGHVLAALSYFLEVNGVDLKLVEYHQALKWTKYRQHGLPGVQNPPEVL